MSTIELHSGSATMTARADYLLVVEHGTLAGAEEAHRYLTELELAAQKFHLRRLLVDARSETDESDAAGDARAAMWKWLRSQRAFDMIGYVLRDEMMIARVNMTALSERLPIRAFVAVADGHRWLARQRPSSTAMPLVRPHGSSSVPPPPMPGRTPIPARAPTPIPIRSPMPTPPSSSAPGAPARQTQRTSALSSQEADAILAPRVTSTSVRETQKIPAVDAATAEEVVRSADGPLRRPGEPGTPAAEETRRKK